MFSVDTLFICFSILFTYSIAVYINALPSAQIFFIFTTWAESECIKKDKESIYSYFCGCDWREIALSSSPEWVTTAPLFLFLLLLLFLFHSDMLIQQCSDSEWHWYHNQGLNDPEPSAPSVIKSEAG